MNLTAGALAKICDGQEVADPVLQVLGHKPIHFGVTRYRLLLSDGQYSNSFSMMASQLNNLIHENQLSQYSIIRVKKHVCNTTDDLSKKVLVILEVEVEDEGRYECRVFTEYDKTSSSGLVTVLSEPPTITAVPNNIRNSVDTRDSKC